jgi:hypothetical protein
MSAVFVRVVVRGCQLIPNESARAMRGGERRHGCCVYAQASHEPGAWLTRSLA